MEQAGDLTLRCEPPEARRRLPETVVRFLDSLSVAVVTTSGDQVIGLNRAACRLLQLGEECDRGCTGVRCISAVNALWAGRRVWGSANAEGVHRLLIGDAFVVDCMTFPLRECAHDIEAFTLIEAVPDGQSLRRLGDFAMVSADWLWEADAKGKLVSVTKVASPSTGASGGSLEAGEDENDPPSGPGCRDGDRAEFRTETFKAAVNGSDKLVLACARAMERDADSREIRLRSVRLELKSACGGEPRIFEFDGLAIVDQAGVLTGWRGAARDVTRRVVEEAEVRWRATHDSLTGLFNRAAFEDQLRERLAEAQGLKSGFSVVLIDLDGFKAVNDTYGHAAGDRLLVEVAKRLSNAVRNVDVLARLGGDEFAIMQCEIKGLGDGSALGRRLLTGLSEPIDIGERSVVVEMSGGIAFYPDDAMTSQELMRCADLALYKAKEVRGNAFLFYMPQMAAQIARRHRLEQDLREVVRSGDLKLVYQPQIDLETGRVMGCEALVRWNHGSQGPVAPEFFVGIAEEYGHIHDLGMWVVGEALRQVRAWKGELSPDFTTSINISAIELRRDDFVDAMLLAIHDNGVDPHMIEFEITERSRLGDDERMVETLDRLSREGLRFAIDDFGTGYSNLASLGQLPFKTLKIDRSFVGGLVEQSPKGVICKAIIALGRSLDMRTIAEGVETIAQAHALKELGCPIIQGFAVLPPAPPDAFLQFVEAFETSRRPTIERLRPLEGKSP